MPHIRVLCAGFLNSPPMSCCILTCSHPLPNFPVRFAFIVNPSAVPPAPFGVSPGTSDTRTSHISSALAAGQDPGTRHEGRYQHVPSG